MELIVVLVLAVLAVGALERVRTSQPTHIVYVPVEQEQPQSNGCMPLLGFAVLVVVLLMLLMPGS